MKKIYVGPLVAFLIGMMVTILGSLFKIMHWPYGNTVLTIGLSIEMISIILIIVTIIKNSK